MRISVRPLLTLAFAHSYYSDGALRDVRFLLPTDTRNLLRDGRIIVREQDGALVLFQEIDDADLPISSIAGRTLRIGAMLTSPWLTNITDLPTGFPSRKLVYRNSPPTTLAAPTLATLSGALVSHPLSDAARPLSVAVKNAAGEIVSSRTLEAGNEETEMTIDVRSLPAGEYLVEETSAGVTTQTRYYCDAELAGSPISLLAELTIDESFQTTPPTLTISFVAREQTLKYYLVVRSYSEAEFAQLSVSDEGASDDDRDPILFTRVESEDFTEDDLESSSIAGDEEMLVLFRSQTPLARRQNGRRRIQLNKNGDMLIAHLPQPGIERGDADVIVHLSKP